MHYFTIISPLSLLMFERLKVLITRVIVDSTCSYFIEKQKTYDLDFQASSDAPLNLYPLVL